MTEQDLSEEEKLRHELEDDLLRLYGPLIPSEELWKVLGYQSKGAFRQAITRKRVPVPLFGIEYRRGKFALSKDVAAFLAAKRYG